MGLVRNYLLCPLIILVLGSCQRDTQQFILLSHKRTGISFRNPVKGSLDHNALNDSYFYNGAGTAPAVGDELLVSLLDGGSATLGFQVETSCSDSVTLNQADVSTADTEETAIAVTSCE